MWVTTLSHSFLMESPFLSITVYSGRIWIFFLRSTRPGPRNDTMEWSNRPAGGELSNLKQGPMLPFYFRGRKKSLLKNFQKCPVMCVPYHLSPKRNRKSGGRGTLMVLLLLWWCHSLKVLFLKVFILFTPLALDVEWPNWKTKALW